MLKTSLANTLDGFRLRLLWVKIKKYQHQFYNLEKFQ